MAGKLAKFKTENRALRSQVRSLNSELGELGGKHNPSVLRRYIGVAVKDGTAYGSVRLYIYLQQRGLAPMSVPLDVIAGTAMQAVTAFFEGPISAFVGDVGDGMAEGGLGRLATIHGLKSTETADGVCLLIPSKPKV